MAPVSRCDLRLPCTPKPPKTDTPKDEQEGPSTRGLGSASGAKLSDPVTSGGSAKSKLSDPGITGGSAKLKSSDPGTTGGSAKLKSSDQGTTGGSAKSQKSHTLPRLSERLGKSQEFPDGMGIELDVTEDSEKIPESAHDKRTRDSAEVLEEDSEFRTSVTRDSYEAEQHAGHDVGGGSDVGGELDTEEELDACEILRRCKAEVEASGECEQMACPRLDQIGTPGDVCAQFCHDRMDSPKSVAEAELLTSGKKNKYCAKWSKKGKVECDMRLGPRQRRGSKPEVICKGTYKTEETYTSLWGSSKAMDFRQRLESQMKKKRNLLEKMHRKEFLRRQKMRRRAKEKRRALKQRDPSKISNGDDNLRINKAYDLRVNYNKQLPMMPITMQQHFDKFKKPPFKTYVTGQRVCTKRIDEFEKLRVPEKDKK